MINICFATDENYLKFMATTMLSILDNSSISDEFHFYILCNNISNTSKQYITDLKKFKTFEIDFIDVDIDKFKDFPAGGEHITNTTYYRYKIAELCPDIDKIIYLDCDIIVQTSLQGLFNINIDDYWLAGVEDVGYVYGRNIVEEFKYMQEIYINAGVLLINLKKWRENNLFDKLMQYTYNNAEDLSIGDQDVINNVCINNILKLEYKWNIQDSFYRNGQEIRSNKCKKEIKKAVKSKGIIHYTFKYKPWNSIEVHAAQEWFKYYLLLTKTETSDFLRKKIMKYQYIYPFVKLKKIFRNFIKKIFSISNEPTHKVLCIMFIRIKFKRKIHKKSN